MWFLSKKSLFFYSILAFLITVFCGGIFVASAQVPLPQDPTIPAGATTVWGYISTSDGIKNIWKLSLSLVDFLVVGGLLVAAFANIFRIQVKSYEIKQILPGLIIGIILANLSFFIMRLFIEMASVATQMLGIIVAGYIHKDIGSASATSFIFTNEWNEMLRSLMTFPDYFKNSLGLDAVQNALAGGGSLVGLGSLAVWSMALTGVTGGILIILFIVLAVIATPLILFLILLFLLFIRNYVLVVAFMVAPIAFFSLGFPPLKMVWQRWWGTFWKWLLMAPTAMAVLAFNVIFLNKFNNGDGGNVFNYFFVNGVGIALMFLANRIPFMWSTFFGFNFNPMKEWAGLGKKGTTGAYRLAKVGEDKARSGINTLKYRGRGNALRGTLSIGQMENLNKKYNLKLPYDASKYATPDAYREALRRKLLAAKISDDKKTRARNLLRAPESAYQGIQKYLSLQDEAEKKAITDSDYYGGTVDFRNPLTGKKIINAYRSTDPVRRDKLFSKQDNIAKGVDDIYDIQGSLRENMQAWAEKNSDISQEQMVNILEEYRTKSDVDKKNAVLDEDFRGLDEEKVYGLLHFYDRGTRLLNQSPNQQTLNRLEPHAQAMGLVRPGERLRGVKGQMAWLRLGAGSGGDGDVKAKNTDVPVPYGATPTDEQVKQKELEEARQAFAEGKATPEQKQKVQELATSVKQEAERAILGAQQTLREQLMAQGVAKGAVDSIVGTIYKNVQSEMFGLDPKVFGNLRPDQIQAIAPHLQRFSGSIKGYGRELDVIAAADEIGASGVGAQIIATNLAKGRVKLELDTDNLRQQADDILNKLQAQGLSNERLEGIKVDLGRIAPHLSFDKSKTGEELRADLQKHAKDVRGMVNILNNEEVQQAYRDYNSNDPNSLGQLKKTIRVATHVEEMKKSVLDQVSTEVDNNLKQIIEQGNKPSEVISTSPEIVQKVMVPVKTLINYKPSTQTQLASMGEEEQEAKVKEIAEKVLVEVAKGVDDGVTTARSFREDNKDNLHDFLTHALKEGFSNVSPPQ